MIGNKKIKNQRLSDGQSLIELAILLPILLMFVFGVVDYARAIQVNNILVAMSREGANLVSRTTEEPQHIIRALTNTAEPLDMGVRGRIYITEVMGRLVDSTCVDTSTVTCATYPQVQAQTRSLNGSATLGSQVWTCPTGFDASDGSCLNPGSWTSPVQTKAVLPIVLRKDEIVYAVEAIYDYNVIVKYVMKTSPELYSLTVL